MPASSGPFTPTAFANIVGVWPDWSNPDQAASDPGATASLTTEEITPDNDRSDLLYCSGFQDGSGGAIADARPAGEVVTGVVVSFDLKSVGAVNPIGVVEAFLTTDGSTALGGSKSTVSGVLDQTITLGGEWDAWGGVDTTDLGVNFGVAVAVQLNPATAPSDAEISNLQITELWTGPAPVAQIDRRVVGRMLAAALQTEADVALLFPGEPVADGQGVYAQLVAVDLTDLARTISPGQAHVASGSVALTVYADPANTRLDAFALDTAMSRVAAALSGTVLRDSGSRHTVHSLAARTSGDRQAHADTRQRSGAVLIDIVVVRDAIVGGVSARDDLGSLNVQ